MDTYLTVSFYVSCGLLALAFVLNLLGVATTPDLTRMKEWSGGSVALLLFVLIPLILVAVVTIPGVLYLEYRGLGVLGVPLWLRWVAGIGTLVIVGQGFQRKGEPNKKFGAAPLASLALMTIAHIGLTS